MTHRTSKKRSRQPPVYCVQIEEYLEALVTSGIYGDTREEIIQRFVGDGIAQAIRNNVIPPRRVYVSYEIER